jgi:hypothetical protein
MVVKREPFRVVAALVVVASLVISVQAFATRGSSAEAQPTGQSGDCTVIDDLTEETTNFHYVGESLDVPVQNVGESLIYYDTLYDPRNNVVGHAVGFVSAIYRRPSDGHLMTQYYETVHLPDGSFSDSGINDRADIFDGGTAHFSAIGSSGKYLGRKGTREWQLLPPIERPPKKDARTRVKIVLCR